MFWAAIGFILQLHVSVLIVTCFFFNDTATTEIYTLSLHDALPIYRDGRRRRSLSGPGARQGLSALKRNGSVDRKSTRLNSSHANISYAVFCLKKKKISEKLRLRNARLIEDYATATVVPLTHVEQTM